MTKRARQADLLHHDGTETHLLRAVVRTYQVLMARFSRSVGLPAAQFLLLRLIATAGRPVGTMALARQLGVDAAAVSRQLKGLEADGLVVRCPDPEDRRRASVKLSRKGARRFASVHARTHALERGLSAVIDPAEAARAVEVLDRLRAFVEAAAEEG